MNISTALQSNKTIDFEALENKLALEGKTFDELSLVEQNKLLIEFTIEDE